MSIRALALVLVLPSLATAQVIDLVSRNAQGVPSDTGSGGPVLSLDGRILVFSSRGTNLVPGASNGRSNLFVRDQNGGITLVSRGLGGLPANDDSFPAMISGDGRVVAFLSLASNLVPDDTNGQRDVFAFDRLQGTLERINVDSLGGQSASSYPLELSYVSRDGRYVVFSSPSGDLVPDDGPGYDVFLRDRLSGETSLLSTNLNGTPIQWDSYSGTYTPSGHYFLFTTQAPLVNGDFNGELDVYLRNLQTHTYERVSVSSQEVEGIIGSSGGAITADGRYVAFSSSSNNLVPGDVNNQVDLFVRDRLLGTTERVTVSTQGTQANRESWSPVLTGEGRYVTFASAATNLVPNDTNGKPDVFERDRHLGTTRRLLFLPDPAGSWPQFAMTPDRSHFAFVHGVFSGSVWQYQVYLRVQPASGPSPIR